MNATEPARPPHICHRRRCLGIGWVKHWMDKVCLLVYMVVRCRVRIFLDCIQVRVCGRGRRRSVACWQFAQSCERVGAGRWQAARSVWRDHAGARRGHDADQNLQKMLWKLEPAATMLLGMCNGVSAARQSLKCDVAPQPADATSDAPTSHPPEQHSFASHGSDNSRFLSPP